jgi:hypothetical protein
MAGDLRPSIITARCLSLALGTLLAFFVPFVIIGLGASLDSRWLWLAPGWPIFNPGRDDGPQIIAATVLTTLMYSAACYVAGRILLRKAEGRSRTSSH